MRNQAERCRRLARQITDHQVAKALSELAEDFDKRAIALECCSHDLPE